MIRLSSTIFVATLLVSGLGCSDDKKAIVPTKMVSPPGPDTPGGETTGRTKVKHTDKGATPDSTSDSK